MDRDATQSPRDILPEDVRTAHSDLVSSLAGDDEAPEDISAFQALFTPRNRGRILDVFISISEPQTATQICDQADIARSTFDHHVDVLITAGIVEEAAEIAGATTYRPNRSNPVTQLLTMAKEAQTRGKTPLLLEEQFIGDAAEDYEPGDHPADPGDWDLE